MVPQVPDVKPETDRCGMVNLCLETENVENDLSPSCNHRFSGALFYNHVEHSSFISRFSSFAGQSR